MPPRYEESEFVFCDLQNVFRYIRGDDEAAAKRFLEAGYDAFEFLATNPAIGRPRLEFEFEDLRSWRIQGFRSYLIFYRELTDRIQIWRVLHGARDLPQLL